MESNLTQLFTGYGLTKNQAKIFTTLNQNKTWLTVKELTQQTNIARESIYSILTKLKEKSLIEKSITKPKKYMAIPLKASLTLLYQQKNQQIHELAKLTTQALMDNNQNSKISHIKTKSQFILIPKNNQLAHKISKTISNSKKLLK